MYLYVPLLSPMSRTTKVSGESDTWEFRNSSSRMFGHLGEATSLP